MQITFSYDQNLKATLICNERRLLKTSRNFLKIIKKKINIKLNETASFIFHPLEFALSDPAAQFNIFVVRIDQSIFAPIDANRIVWRIFR